MHDAASGELRFFTASRAHHAEIGGIVPGSMPPLSKNLAEEGVLIRNLKIVAAGESRFDELRARSACAAVSDARCRRRTWPTSRPKWRRTGKVRMIWRRWSSDTRGRSCEQYMNFVQDAAEQKVRLALATVAGWDARVHRLPGNGRRQRACRFRVRFTIHAAERSEPAATIDFTGTGPVVDGNLNANRAIVTAAVIYVLRLLVDEDIPLNHGVLRPIEIVLPTCLLNPEPGPTPETTPAVAGGNVETSQRVVDVLLGALGRCRREPGHDEQRRVRRRRRSATTKRSAAAAARRPTGRARARCKST